jgi:hypothetical protein
MIVISILSENSGTIVIPNSTSSTFFPVACLITSVTVCDSFNPTSSEVLKLISILSAP